MPYGNVDLNNINSDDQDRLNKIIVNNPNPRQAIENYVGKSMNDSEHNQLNKEIKKPENDDEEFLSGAILNKSNNPFTTKSDAVSFAKSMAGLRMENPKDREKMKNYMSSVGLKTDPATVGWCGEFVSASLRHGGFAAPSEFDASEKWLNDKYFSYNPRSPKAEDAML